MSLGADQFLFENLEKMEKEINEIKQYNETLLKEHPRNDNCPTPAFCCHGMLFEETLPFTLILDDCHPAKIYFGAKHCPPSFHADAS